MGDHSVHLREESGLARDRCPVTIDMLSDNVLVEIFGFCAIFNNFLSFPPRNTWDALMHVCRRWRYLVFVSPRRLNLRLTYDGRRPMSELLDTWPILPVILRPGVGLTARHWWDNSVAALESEHYNNRICEMKSFI